MVVTVSLLIVRSLWGRFRAVGALHVLMSIIGHDVLPRRLGNLTECVLWPGLEDMAWLWCEVLNDGRGGGSGIWGGSIRMGGVWLILVGTTLGSVIRSLSCHSGTGSARDRRCDRVSTLIHLWWSSNRPVGSEGIFVQNHGGAAELRRFKFICTTAVPLAAQDKRNTES